MLKPERPPRPAHFADHFVRGHRFRLAHWRAEGPSGRPLLFFSGIGANIELFAPFLERIRDRDVITFDMPGIGGSEVYGSPYRLSTVADAARQIATDLGYAQLDVMGVSWGGMLAQEFAYRHQDSVDCLVLVATSPGMPMIPGSLTTLWKMVSSHRYSDPVSMQPYLDTLYGGTGGNLDSYASRMTAPSSTGYLHQVLAILGWTSVRKLTQIPAKTLILMGEEDRLVPPANGYILKFLVNEGQLEILPDAGHLLLLTHMDAALETIDAFLGGPAQVGLASSSRLQRLAVLS